MCIVLLPKFLPTKKKMRKILLLTAAMISVASTAFAGGYLTNSNQSVSFLRNPARDAYIAIDGAYFNPAGIGFLSKGWHMGFDIQSAYQTRTSSSYFAPFAAGTVNGVANPAGGRKDFDGKATAPVIPSIDLARVADKWFFSFHFGITGGGGKCKFDDGLGSFESQVALLPDLINALQPGAVSGYSMDTRMQGRQYYFGGQFGVGYKVTDKFNVSVGGRVVYADCNYYGHVRNIQVGVNTPQGVVYMPAAQLFESQGMPDFAALAGNRELNCDQTGWGFTPVIGVDYNFGKLNVAAKYEFKTRLRLKNKSGINTSGLAEYDDGKEIAADIPAILTLGAKYDVLDNLRVSTGFHYYFDKQATQYEHKENHLAGGGWEVLAGVEYDINDRFTVSAGWQTTNYGLGDDSQFLSDMSFVTNSNSVGLGARIKIKKRIHLNVAYFKTIYTHYKKNMKPYDKLDQKAGAMVNQLTAALTADAQYQQSVLANPNATAEQRASASARLGVIAAEAGAAETVLGAVGAAMGSGRYDGFDKFHRTNDVFGLGMEIDF